MSPCFRRYSSRSAGAGGGARPRERAIALSPAPLSRVPQGLAPPPHQPPAPLVGGDVAVVGDDVGPDRVVSLARRHRATFPFPERPPPGAGRRRGPPA